MLNLAALASTRNIDNGSSEDESAALAEAPTDEDLGPLVVEVRAAFIHNDPVRSIGKRESSPGVWEWCSFDIPHIIPSISNRRYLEHQCVVVSICRAGGFAVPVGWVALPLQMAVMGVPFRLPVVNAGSFVGMVRGEFHLQCENKIGRNTTMPGHTISRRNTTMPGRPASTQVLTVVSESTSDASAHCNADKQHPKEQHFKRMPSEIPPPPPMPDSDDDLPPPPPPLPPP